MVLNLLCLYEEMTIKDKGENDVLLCLFDFYLYTVLQAYEKGYVMPNQYFPDLLSPPLSLSAHLRFGCLSVRNFYWRIHDKFKEVVKILFLFFPA